MSFTHCWMLRALGEVPYIKPLPISISISIRILPPLEYLSHFEAAVLRFSLFDDTFAESLLAPPTVLLGFGTAGGTNAGKIRRLLRLNSGMANFYV